MAEIRSEDTQVLKCLPRGWENFVKKLNNCDKNVFPVLCFIFIHFMILTATRMAFSICGIKSQQTAVLLRFNLACRMKWASSCLSFCTCLRCKYRLSTICRGKVWSPESNLESNSWRTSKRSRALDGNKTKQMLHISSWLLRDVGLAAAF